MNETNTPDDQQSKSRLRPLGRTADEQQPQATGEGPQPGQEVKPRGGWGRPYVAPPEGDVPAKRPTPGPRPVQ